MDTTTPRFATSAARRWRGRRTAPWRLRMSQATPLRPPPSAQANRGVSRPAQRGDGGVCVRARGVAGADARGGGRGQ
eukprot:2794652-Pyramimonas_sp.AAC.1